MADGKIPENNQSGDFTVFPVTITKLAYYIENYDVADERDVIFKFFQKLNVMFKFLNEKQYFQNHYAESLQKVWILLFWMTAIGFADFRTSLSVDEKRLKIRKEERKK